MTRNSIILLGLLFPAMGMAAMQVVWPGEGLELLCLVYAVPVIIINGWEWFEPGIKICEELSKKRYGIFLMVGGLLVIATFFLAQPLDFATVGFGIRKLIGVVSGFMAYTAGLIATSGEEGRWFWYFEKI